MREGAEAGKATGEWEGLSLAVLKRRPYFILALVATFLVGIVNYGVYPVIAAYVQDQGMSAVQAASVQGVMFLTMALAKIFEGAMCDKFSAKSVMIGCLLCTIFGLVFLILSRNEAMAMAGAILFSVGLAVPSIMLPVLTAELFGRRDYGTVLGLTLAMVSLSWRSVVPGGLNFSYDLLRALYPRLFRDDRHFSGHPGALFAGVPGCPERAGKESIRRNQECKKNSSVSAIRVQWMPIT